MCACGCVHMCIRVNMCLWVCACVYVSVHVCACTCVCMCMSACVPVHVYLCVHECACVHMCVSERAHVCACAHLYNQLPVCHNTDLFLPRLRAKVRFPASLAVRGSLRGTGMVGEVTCPSSLRPHPLGRSGDPGRAPEPRGSPATERKGSGSLDDCVEQNLCVLVPVGPAGWFERKKSSVSVLST